MTVNKLQLPAKDNAVQLKINEIIDNLGGGGANTDLSNLTATGEAHFLKNTSSYNYALGILGVANADSAISIGYGSTAGQNCTALGKNAKANGSYAIQIGEGINTTSNSLYFGFENNNYQLLDGTTGLIPDTRISTNIQRTSTAVTHTANTAVGSSTTPVYINSSGVATSTGLSIANSRFDGQWTWKYQVVENNSKAVGSYSYALSNYLPDTTNKYEIFVRTRAEYDSALSIYGIGTVASPADNMSLSGQYFFQTYVQGNSRVAASSFILPFNANGTLYYQVKSAKLAGLAIQLCGYRRIGTNT